MPITEELTAVLIECSTSDGMLDNERAVVIESANRGKVSLFADRSLVVGSGEVQQTLKCYVQASDSELSGLVEVLLPTEAFETGSRWIQVEAAKVRKA